MKQVTRYDVGELRASINEDGYLEDTPIVGRIGVLEYKNIDGSIRRELRLPEEVFHPESLASYRGKPITLGHPYTDGLVNSSNAKRLQVGTMLEEARQDGDYIRVPIVIHDGEAIKKALSGGANQLSLGYLLELEESPGEWNGQRYDCIQRNIRVNHNSLVTTARAGGMARLNLDGDEEFIINDDNHNNKGKTMQKIRLDSGLEYEAAPEIAVAFHSQKQRLDEAESQLSGLKTELTKTTAERDTLKADAADFDNKIKQAREDAANEIKARAELEAKATKHDVKCDGLDDTAVRKAVLAKLKPGLNLDGKDDTYIGVAFDMAVESAPMEAQRKTINQDKADPKPVAASGAAAARQRMIENQLNGANQ